MLAGAPRRAGSPSLARAACARARPHHVPRLLQADDVDSGGARRVQHLRHAPHDAALLLEVRRRRRVRACILDHRDARHARRALLLGRGVKLVREDVEVARLGGGLHLLVKLHGLHGLAPVGAVEHAHDLRALGGRHELLQDGLDARVPAQRAVRGGRSRRSLARRHGPRHKSEGAGGLRGLRRALARMLENAEDPHKLQHLCNIGIIMHITYYLRGNIIVCASTVAERGGGRDRAADRRGRARAARVERMRFDLASVRLW